MRIRLTTPIAPESGTGDLRLSVEDKFEKEVMAPGLLCVASFYKEDSTGPERSQRNIVSFGSMRSLNMPLLRQ